MNNVSFDRGTKRSCLSCEARFYDLGRTPAICPKCGVECVEIVRVVSPSYRNRKAAFAKGRPLPVEEQEAVQPEAANEDEEREEGDEREVDEEDDTPADAEDAE